MGISLTKQFRSAFVGNNEVLQGAFCISTPTVSYKSTPNVSTDPFSTKTKKYAESKLVELTTITKGCHVRFGDSSIGDATTSDYLVPAGTSRYFLVDDDYPYMRIIEADASATVVVTELY